VGGNAVLHIPSGKWLESVFAGGNMLLIGGAGNYAPLELQAGIGIKF
jgi:hypothetical protein